MARDTQTKDDFGAPWDIAAALGLLSRLPVRIDTRTAPPRAGPRQRGPTRWRV